MYCTIDPYYELGEIPYYILYHILNAIRYCILYYIPDNELRTVDNAMYCTKLYWNLPYSTLLYYATLYKCHMCCYVYVIMLLYSCKHCVILSYGTLDFWVIYIYIIMGGTIHYITLHMLTKTWPDNISPCLISHHIIS